MCLRTSLSAVVNKLGNLFSPPQYIFTEGAVSLEIRANRIDDCLKFLPAGTILYSIQTLLVNTEYIQLVYFAPCAWKGQPQANA